jgi:hypothetical protein
MIPFRLTQPQFRERYAKCLAKRSPQSIATLRHLFALPIGADVERAEIRVFVGDENPYTPSVWIYYTGQHNKVDNVDASVFAGRSMQLALGLDELETFNDRFFTDEKFGGLDIVAATLTAWVAECWWKAGGWSYPLPAALDVAEGYGGATAIKLTEA